MPLFALTENNIFTGRTQEAAVAQPLPGKPQFKWLPLIDINPPFNSETQKRTGPAVVVSADSVTRTWTVTDKTAAELDAEKDAEATGQIDGQKLIKAVVRWVAPLVGKTAAQARDEIIAIYKGLP